MRTVTDITIQRVTSHCKNAYLFDLAVVGCLAMHVDASLEVACSSVVAGAPGNHDHVHALAEDGEAFLKYSKTQIKKGLYVTTAHTHTPTRLWDKESYLLVGAIDEGHDPVRSPRGAKDVLQICITNQRDQYISKIISITTFTDAINYSSRL